MLKPAESTQTTCARRRIVLLVWLFEEEREQKGRKSHR